MISVWKLWFQSLKILIFSGTASVAKAMTNYLDSLLGYPQKNYMKKNFPMHMDFLGEYPDVVSFVFIMVISCNWNIIFNSKLTECTTYN